MKGVETVNIYMEKKNGALIIAKYINSDQQKDCEKQFFGKN